MDFSYPTKPLTDFAKLSSGGTPSKAKSEYWDGDIPWITPKDMGDWSGLTANKVTNDAVGNGTRIAPAFSSFIAVRGMSLHKEIRVVRTSFPATFNQDIKAVQAFDHVNRRFLYYCLVAHKPTLLNKVESAGHGTGRLPTDQLESLPIPDIEADACSAIVKILGDLDDKIDLLREMNRTLEEIARAVFRAWFVDFEPVRAKAAGATSFRGMPQALFDQLPDSFTPSDLGDIPTGWTVGRVGDVVELVRTSVKPFENPDEIYQHFSLPSFDRDQEPDFDAGSSIKSSKYSIPADAVLFSKLNPRIPRVWWPRHAAPDHQQIASTEFLVCVARQDWSRSYAYCLFTQPPFIEGLTKQASGTSNSHQRIKPDQFESVSIPVPPIPLRQGFLEFAAPLLERVIENREQRGTLAALRDTLLPKLISGELPAPDLEALGLTLTVPAEASDGG